MLAVFFNKGDNMNNLGRYKYYIAFNYVHEGALTTGHFYYQTNTKMNTEESYRNANAFISQAIGVQQIAILNVIRLRK